MHGRETFFPRSRNAIYPLSFTVWVSFLFSVFECWSGCVFVREREGELVTRSPLKAADPIEGSDLLWEIAMTELNKRSS